MNDARPQLVVVGGGYAGVLAANRLCGRMPRAEVLLLTPGSRFVDRIRLHEAAARGRAVTRPWSKLLHRRVRLIDGRLGAIDPVRRRLEGTAADGARLVVSYDAAILALGSELRALPAAGAHAYALASERAAHALAGQLAARAGGVVSVVGGGLTAVELAAEIAEAHRHLRVQVCARQVMPGLDGRARHAVLSALAELGVQVLEGVEVAEITEDGPRLADGASLRSELTVAAGGLVPSAAARALGLACAADGRLRVEPSLAVAGAQHLFAVGDVAAPPATSIGSGVATSRMACATAMPMAAHAADQVARGLAGHAPTRYAFAYAMQCISLGRRRAVALRVSADDVPSGAVLTGRRGALVKELVCRYVLGALRLERLVPGLYTWPGRGRGRSLPAPGPLPS